MHGPMRFMLRCIWLTQDRKHSLSAQYFRSSTPCSSACVFDRSLVDAAAFALWVRRWPCRTTPSTWSAMIQTAFYVPPS
eukprot:1000886-Amphidinium_carterae.2